MNIGDVLDPEYGLQQDEWSLSKPTFGEEGQLQVIGWSGKSNSNNYYILKCSRCSEDSELFGAGIFRSGKSNLTSGQIPCGCSKKTKWSKEQFQILCSRKAEELGYIFLGFTGRWQGQTTKIKMSCEKHGEWSSGNIANLINRGHGCPGCKAAICGNLSKKPDSIMVESFHKSGAFHPNTKFWRSERLRSGGIRTYWFMSCGECGEVGESESHSLQLGCRSCACSKHRQQESYINLVIDNDKIIAIKFGIANNSKERIKAQNRKAVYEVRPFQVYTFPDVASCKKAERACKKGLECAILLKRDMPGGYTETTWIYNLSKIQDIYKKFGGVLQNTLDTDQITA